MQVCFIKSKTASHLIYIIKSYLLQRVFRVKYEGAFRRLKKINSEIPQGNMLKPVLYLLYIADLPVALNAITAVYANDTTILVAYNNPFRSKKATLIFRSG